MKNILFVFVFLIIVFVCIHISSITVVQNDVNSIIDINGSGILKITQRNIGIEIIKYYYFNNELLIQFIIEYTYGNIQDAKNKYVLETKDNNNVELYNKTTEGQYVVKATYDKNTLWQVFFELPNKNDLIIQAEKNYLTWSYEKIFSDF